MTISKQEIEAKQDKAADLGILSQSKIESHGANERGSIDSKTMTSTKTLTGKNVELNPANTDQTKDQTIQNSSITLTVKDPPSSKSPVNPSPSKSPVTPSPSKSSVTPSSSKGPVTPSPSKSSVKLSPSKGPVTPSPSKSPVIPAPSKSLSRKSLQLSPAKAKVASPSPSRNLLTPSILVNDKEVHDGEISIRRMARSARRAHRAASSNSVRKKKKRAKSESVLREKKKDKWSNYASKFANVIEMEELTEPVDKWNSYVKNCIDATNSPILKKAEKKIVTKSNKKEKTKRKSKKYSDSEDDNSSDDSDSETDNNYDSSDTDGSDCVKKERKKKRSKKKKAKEKLKTIEKENKDSDKKRNKKQKKDSNIKQNVSDDDNDNSDQEENVPTSESENEDEKQQSKQKSNQNTDSGSSDDELDAIDHKRVLLEKLEKTVIEGQKSEDYENQNRNKPPETDKTVIDRDYKNGPIIDFQAQIRKISSTAPNELIDPTKLETPDKKITNKFKVDEISDAIDDILGDGTPKLKTRRMSLPESKRTDKNQSRAQRVSSSLDDDFMSLEESILKDHDRKKLSTTPKKKESSVDDLLEELNL